jgi:peptide chain release factor 1
VLDDTLLAKLSAVEHRYEELGAKLSDPEVLGRSGQMQKLAKEHADLRELIETLRVYRDLGKRLDEAKELERDPEMRELARQEQGELGAEQTRLEEQLKVLLLPRDPNDDKNILLEIRAGTGGEEAALFANDLFRMYTRFAERRRWKVEIMSLSSASAGGLKEVVAAVEGKGAYAQLKYESGVHRVQRVPATEAQGRIHTSTATVAVMPEVEEVEVHIDPKDLKIDVMRSGGPGGQSVNTTDSAVRITHKPTGIVVSMQDEKSQLQNRAKALRVLRARLLSAEQERQQAEASGARRDQIGGGGRSEKIRTYNFKENRVTDHRVDGLTLYKLDKILAGELDDVVDALVAHDRMRRLEDEAAAAR